jgi:hypothetical protein
MPIIQTMFRHRYDVSQKRLEICKTCPYYDKNLTRCEKCGCFMEFKTLLMDSECPIGKWKAEEDKDE